MIFGLLLFILTASPVHGHHPDKVRCSCEEADEQIVLFGDSLSDNGNGVGQLYDFQFPLPPYYNFRFSNGPVWIELFPTKDLHDYAYGGAVVNQSASNNGPPSLMGQVNDYLISNHFNLSCVAKKTQYIFWGGSNDILITLSAQTSQGFNESLAALAVGLPLLTAGQIGKLINAGAIDILVMLLPSWSNTPLAAALSSHQRQLLSQFTEVINADIISKVSAVATSGVNLKFFDVVTFTQMIIDNPGNYGLVNVTFPCLVNYKVFIHGVGGEEPIVCANPDEYLFWDGEHPTAKVHTIIANEVMRLLGWRE